MTVDAFQARRPRRLRRTRVLRDMFRENTLSVKDLVMPIFVDEGIKTAVSIDSMPGIFRIPEADIKAEVVRLWASGIRCVMPFGISHNKDAEGSDTWRDGGLVARMIRAIKLACPDIIVIPDICFCEYTIHGHCGVLVNNDVDNDLTVANLVKQSLNAARAGADMLAPSSMMDGQVRAIRGALDDAGYTSVGILAHAVKFGSAFYGPFRTAVDCQLAGNRETYQADSANGRQALIEAELDEAEGADVLMVKPGTPYLDVLRDLRRQTNLPLAAYQVGGEYAALKFASLAGVLDERRAVLETLAAFKRAGADLIVSYYARDVAGWLCAD
jgi:porphobilinogen synthase